MTSETKIPPALVQYVKDPVAEEFTVEIFEDLHYVLDNYIVDLAKERGSAEGRHDIIQNWEKEHHDRIDTKRKEIQGDHGALLPVAFISGNLKVEYLIKSGHAEFQSGAIPDDIVEVMQEFLEIVTYREELEG